MPMNQSLKGKEYPPITFSVERERVVQFADAIGDDTEAYRDADAAAGAGYAAEVAPPTFPTVMQIMASAQVVLDPDLGLDYSRVVHGEQEYRYERPIVVGDVLTAVPRIADIYSKKSMEFIVIESEVTDEQGNPVVTAQTTLISRGTGGQ